MDARNAFGSRGLQKITVRPAKTGLADNGSDRVQRATKCPLPKNRYFINCLSVTAFPARGVDAPTGTFIPWPCPRIRAIAGHTSEKSRNAASEI